MPLQLTSGVPGFLFSVAPCRGGRAAPLTHRLPACSSAIEPQLEPEAPAHATAAPAPAPCFRSLRDSAACRMSIVNESPACVELRWHDYDGAPVGACTHTQAWRDMQASMQAAEDC